MAADERETWTFLVLRSRTTAWTRSPVDAVSNAIKTRHPVKIENGEYVHPDEISRFYSYELWKQKQDELDRVHAAYMDRVNAAAFAKTQRKRRKGWFR